MIDYAVLPPEINSARMYSGAGSGPMLAAGAAWSQLAAEMRSAAGSYSSIDFGADRRQLVGSGVDVDGRRGRSVCGVDEHHCRTG